MDLTTVAELSQAKVNQAIADVYAAGGYVREKWGQSEFLRMPKRALLRAAESVGRPLGDDRFLSKIERATKRRLKPRNRGRNRGPRRMRVVTGN
jgi:hypothetical protein